VYYNKWTEDTNPVPADQYQRHHCTQILQNQSGMEVDDAGMGPATGVNTTSQTVNTAT